MSPHTIRTLWGKAAGRCEYEGCNKLLYQDEVTSESINRAFVAHIVAASPGGERGDKELSALLFNDIDNLMLLCHEHHRLFDSLSDAGQSLSHWYYGHLHQSWNSTVNGIRFCMLDIVEGITLAISGLTIPFLFRSNLSVPVVSQKKWKQDYILDNESYFLDKRGSPSKTVIDCPSNKPDIAGWDA